MLGVQSTFSIGFAADSVDDTHWMYFNLFAKRLMVHEAYGTAGTCYPRQRLRSCKLLSRKPANVLDQAFGPNLGRIWLRVSESRLFQIAAGLPSYEHLVSIQQHPVSL